jgi:hypothetical protein
VFGTGFFCLYFSKPGFSSSIALGSNINNPSFRNKFGRLIGEKKINLIQKINGVDMVFTPYITTRSGQRIYASTYGLKAFCFPATFKSRKQNKKTTPKE